MTLLNEINGYERINRAMKFNEFAVEFISTM